MYRDTFNNQMELLPEFETIFSESSFEFETSVDSRTTKEYIKWVQQSLNTILGTKLAIDGDMGPNTRSAIRSFQRTKAGFKDPYITGKVGPPTEAALIKAGATSPPGTHISTPPPVSNCVNPQDITPAFRKFLTDVVVIITNSKKIAASLKPGIIAMIKAISSVENGIDITKMQVTSCSKIINPLLVGTAGTALAEIDVTNNLLRLTESVWQNAADFTATEDLYTLSEFFKTIAHEKRHATLGTTVRVSPTTVFNQGTAYFDAVRAQYRVEEILANAEEIAVAKRILPGYTVSSTVSQLIRRHWVIVEGAVNATELARLRSLIIQQLRTRYGFANNCDTAMTVGILMSMEIAEWHACFDNGNIYRKIPAGLNACKTNGKYNICFEY
jgi:hypothetical protein